MVGALVFWVLFGCLADYSFPFGQALELMFACFKGTISAKINTLQQQLQRIYIYQPNNDKQVQKLNNLESQAWLYKGILERLGADPSTNHEKIARTLEALDYKRSKILQELEPRRPRSYKFLAGMQNSARTLLASQAEKDYEQFQKIVTNLVLFARSQQPSQIILSEIIDKLATEIAQNTNRISPYRLRLAYRFNELMNILSEKLILNSSDLRKDIQGSTELSQEKQSYINNLQAQISQFSQQKLDLQKRVQELSTYAQRKLSELEKLQNDKSQLSAQKNELEQQYRKLYKYYQQQKTEIDNLKAQISLQQTTNEISTEEHISVEKYRRITNKNEYEYVSGYINSRSGKPVEPYYRRKRKS